jgi:hypothetical protein
MFERPSFEERRQHRRYAISLQLRFAATARSVIDLSFSGRGTVINMSSTGLLFRSETRLLPGDVISTLVDWPRPSSNRAQSLLLQGYVVWSIPPHAGVSVSRYDFVALGPMDTLPSSVRDRVPRAGRETGGDRPLILVVDSSDTYRLLKRMMPRHPVHQVGAVEALTMLQRNEPSIGLLVTESLEGFTSLEPSVPIIYIVPRGATEPKLDTMATSSVVLLEKPLIHRELRAALRQVLEGRRPTSATNPGSHAQLNGVELLPPDCVSH